MAHQIVKQPNGLYAIWSTIVDSFVLIDATPDEIIEDWTASERERLKASVHKAVAALENGEKPYHQFTKSFEDCIRVIRHQHADDEEMLKVLDDLGVSR